MLSTSTERLPLQFSEPEYFLLLRYFPHHTGRSAILHQISQVKYFPMLFPVERSPSPPGKMPCNCWLPLPDIRWLWCGTYKRFRGSADTRHSPATLFSCFHYFSRGSAHFPAPSWMLQIPDPSAWCESYKSWEHCQQQYCESQSLRSFHPIYPDHLPRQILYFPVSHISHHPSMHNIRHSNPWYPACSEIPPGTKLPYFHALPSPNIHQHYG